MLRLAEAMTFARISHEHSVNASPSQGHVHLLGLGDVNVIVLLAVNEHRWGLRLPRVAKWRPLPKRIVIVPWKAAKLRVHQILIKRSRVKTDQVAYARY